MQGTINREKDENGVPVVRSKRKVLEGFIYAQVACQDVLGSRLDTLVKMVLDMGLHSDAGATSEIADTACFLN